MIAPVRHVAFYGYLGSGNIGNDATFETCMDWFRSNHPEVQLSCITIAPTEVAARYGLDSRPLSWHSEKTGGGKLVRTARKAVRRVLDVPRSFALVGEVDAIVVPGMGVLEDGLGVQPWGLPLSLFLVAAACRLRKRRFLLLDVGAHYATNPLTRWFYSATVRLAAHVSYRDQESAASMARSGAGETGAVFPDLVFAYPSKPERTPEPGRVVIGTMAYYGPSDDPRRGKEIRRRYVDTMAWVLADLAQSGHQISLVGGDLVDLDVARELAERALEVPGVPADTIEVHEITTFACLSDEMARADLVIASRFHNLICALRLGRPAISVGYAGKSRHLMEALGVGEHCHDILTFRAEEVIEDIRAIERDPRGAAERIKVGIQEYRSQVHQLLERTATGTLGLADSINDTSAASAEVSTWRT